MSRAAAISSGASAAASSDTRRMGRLRGPRRRRRLLGAAIDEHQADVKGERCGDEQRDEPAGEDPGRASRRRRTGISC